MRKGKIVSIHRKENGYTSGIEHVCLCMSVCVCVKVEGLSKSFFVGFLSFFFMLVPQISGFLSMIDL